jgi:ribonuclease P protein component
MRNRARRRVRELFRLNGEALAGTAVDIVVNVRRSCCGAPWAELEGDYLECLTKAARRLRQRAS